MSETIGFVGTGSMGLPMAHNLLAARFGLRAYNRTKEKARPLAEQGAHMPIPLVSLLHDRLMAGMAKRREDMDWSVLALGVSEDAGIAAKV